MKAVLKVIFITIVISAIISISSLAIAEKSARTEMDHPQTVWIQHGSLTGRVITNVNSTSGVGGAYVALVNASDVGDEYYNTTTDPFGNFQITGMRATYSSVLVEGPDGTSDSFEKGICYYRLYANKSTYGEGYSFAFGVDANQSGARTAEIVIFPMGSFNSEYGPQTVWSNNGKGGIVIGMIGSSYSNITHYLSGGIANAHIVLVNASNVSQEYLNTISDSNGNYNFTGLNATYSSVLMQGPHGLTGEDYNQSSQTYRIYAKDGSGQESCSGPFGMDANVPIFTADMLLSPTPISSPIPVSALPSGTAQMPTTSVSLCLASMMVPILAGGYVLRQISMKK